MHVGNLMRESLALLPQMHFDLCFGNVEAEGAQELTET